MQILFLNLVTDIFPALALGMGKGNKLTMQNPPRNPKEPIIVQKDWINIVVYAVSLALPILLVTYYCSYYLKYESTVCNNITFFSLALSQLWHVFNLSSRKLSFFRNEVTRNKFVWYALFLCLAIVLVFDFITPLSKIVGLGILSIPVWLIILATSFAPLVLIQFLKRVIRVIE